MRVLKLNRSKLIPFLKGLEAFGRVWGPVKDGGGYRYLDADPEQFDLKAIRTRIPAKKFIFPPTHPMVSFKDRQWREIKETRRNVVFGIHPCGIHALNIYHKFYTRIYRDPYYARWRDSTLIVGLSCIPDEYCFCHETGTHTVSKGFDFFITDLEDFLLVWIGSSRGDELIHQLQGLFESATQEDIDRYIDWRKMRDDQFKLDIDLEGMPEIVTFSLKSDIWEKIGNACLGCGACTMVCPTCTCFDTRDEHDLIDRRTTRFRHWYSCLFNEYSMVAGGHNFRETRAERLKLWYTHKLVGFMSEYGRPACVGCGRCLVSCPVDINVYSVVKALTREKSDSFWQRMEVADGPKDE